MAVILVGEVINTADGTGGFNTGNVSGDDPFVEGSGAIGEKAGTGGFEMYTTSLGAGAPYNFSTGGAEEGYHIIMWFIAKGPINATSGLGIIVGDGTNRSTWYVTPTAYKNGFVAKVINPSRDFDLTNAGSFTTTGNPAQLTAISEVGGYFNTLAQIMGNFNNVQLDQFTTGLGLRVDAGSTGTPNTFETVRAADEDTNVWGWWSSAFGTIIGKGKLYIGPSNQTTTSVFNDLAFGVSFAPELVAADFYEIVIEGSGTDVTWELGLIQAGDSTIARWGLTIDPTTNSFSDTDSVLTGFRTFTLDSSATFTGTSFINGTSIVLNGATLSECSIVDANTTSGTALITADTLDTITDCSFEASTGHAIEITTTGTYTFIGNTFTGYGLDGSNDAAIYNNSGGSVTINITGGGNVPTVRNGTGASTTVNQSSTVTLTGMRDNTEVRIYDQGVPPTELAGIEDVVDGTTDNRSFSFTLEVGLVVDIVIISIEFENQRIENFTIPANDSSIPISQERDRNYENP